MKLAGIIVLTLPVCTMADRIQAQARTVRRMISAG